MDDSLNRLTRLTAILLRLQSGRVTSATTLAERFGVSTRTIYRDIRSLEQSGVPVITEDGKGYSLIDGYRMPPVAFTEAEAAAMITAEQLVLRNSDASFVQDYSDAVAKIRAVLRQSTKGRVDLLSKRIAVSTNERKERSSSHLSPIQHALTNFLLLHIEYRKEGAETPSWRSVEPFALLSGEANWVLAAWCRLRKDFRLFRLDRIISLRSGTECFEPHTLSLDDYLRLLRNR